ncbi:type II toxin-antitoxin system RelE/ParE family toxin [Candidatus Saccharibacteria bacterium]|nr:type II toxin-antitoxin system RelE/ParE family toxin [Candidatus Saccharibacteria bacterium]
MAYKLKISPEAEDDIQDCFEYLAFSIEGVGNSLVANKFYIELKIALDKIAEFPEGFSICEDQELFAVGLRKIKMSHYKYDIFYHIVGDVIVVDMVCHNLRDHNKILGSRKLF